MSTTVSVVGCGLMGSALARALNRGGHHVIGFDPDPQRLAALAEQGIAGATSVTEAFARSEVVVINVPTYEVVDKVLRDVGDAAAWQGTTVVNLVSGTPETARACGEVVAGHGADYFEGAILTYPSDIGKPEAMVVFSGSADVWKRHGDTLMALGGASAHVAEDIAAANVLDVAMAGAFFTVSLGALAEAASYVRAQGIDPRVALEAARREAKQVLADVESALDEVATGEHPADQATLDVFLEAAEAWHGAMTGAGQRASLLGAMVHSLRRAHDEGFGDRSFFAITETLGDQPSVR